MGFSPPSSYRKDTRLAIGSLLFTVLRPMNPKISVALAYQQIPELLAKTPNFTSSVSLLTREATEDHASGTGLQDTCNFNLHEFMQRIACPFDDNHRAVL